MAGFQLPTEAELTPEQTGTIQLPISGDCIAIGFRLLEEEMNGKEGCNGGK